MTERAGIIQKGKGDEGQPFRAATPPTRPKSIGAAASPKRVGSGSALIHKE